ncbi:hypothetical protein EV424DRAFT_1474961 [Suillus variegatus]|nr:hypothetical protein EV424DRAFT_1474961 [Suillus variegatus]
MDPVGGTVAERHLADEELESFVVATLSSLIAIEEGTLQRTSSLRLMARVDLGVIRGSDGRLGYFVNEPVISTGLFGLSISMYCFGLSTAFSGLVVSHAPNGALNGNVGVIKSMMVDITDPTNLAQVYTYMPLAWSTGGTIGPIVGGLLSRPVEQFLNTYLYFLACAIVTFLFLREEQIPQRYHPGLVTPTGSSDSLSTEDAARSANGDDSKALPLHSLLIPRVIIAAGNYAAVSFLDIAFRDLQLLFFATTIELAGLIIYSAAMAAGVPMIVIFPILNDVARVQGLSFILWAIVDLQLALWMILNLAYDRIVYINKTLASVLSNATLMTSDLASKGCMFLSGSPWSIRNSK